MTTETQRETALVITVAFFGMLLLVCLSILINWRHTRDCEARGGTYTRMNPLHGHGYACVMPRRSPTEFE